MRLDRLRPLSRSGPASVALLFAVAALALAPVLLNGIGRGDSAYYNLLWSSQIAPRWPADPYLRWLPDSFGGRGAPTFFFYPPAGYWLDAAIDWLTARSMPGRWRLAVTTWLLFALSGITMRGWLIRYVPPPMALVAGVALVVAPYHLLDHYWRAALAELTAIAVLPAALAAAAASVRGWRGVPCLALAYALLVCAHLPSAMLASVSILPAVMAGSVRSWRARPLAGAGVRAGLGVALGLGLAAIYLGPALLLQDSTSIALMWRPAFQPTPWLIVSYPVWQDVPLMLAVSALALAHATGCAALLLLVRSQAGAGPVRPLVRSLAIMGLAGVALLAGVVPAVWDLPGLGKVQFPWRLLAPVEIGSIAALVLATRIAPPREVLRIAIVMAVLSAPAIAILAWHSARDAFTAGTFMRTEMTAELVGAQDASEYLPAGLSIPQIQDFAFHRAATLPRAGMVSCMPAAALCMQQDGWITVEALQPTTVLVQSFYFPGWQARTAAGTVLPIAASIPDRLLEVTTPAGLTRFSTARIRTTPEQAGAAVSALSLVCVLGWIVASLVRRVRR